MSYCEGVVQAVERRAAGRPVARLGVRIGAVHRVVAAAFQQSFELVAAGGVAEGAQTELVVVPVQGSCRACGAQFDAADPAPACPRCGSLDVGVQGGDEIVLEWLEYSANPVGADTAGGGSERAGELVPEHAEHTHATTGGH